MAEEAVPDPCAFGSALDQAGNIGKHEFAALVRDHAQLGNQRGEGVVTDLGPRVRHLVDEGALARIGQTQQADIGQQL